MHFQYLVEDQSGAALIRILMQKIVELYPNATYDCKGFRGIGGFTRKNTIKESTIIKLAQEQSEASLSYQDEIPWGVCRLLQLFQGTNYQDI